MIRLPGPAHPRQHLVRKKLELLVGATGRLFRKQHVGIRTVRAYRQRLFGELYSPLSCGLPRLKDQVLRLIQWPSGSAMRFSVGHEFLEVGIDLIDRGEATLDNRPTDVP
jgi:hypothetical protein